VGPLIVAVVLIVWPALGLRAVRRARRQIRTHLDSLEHSLQDVAATYGMAVLVGTEALRVPHTPGAWPAVSHAISLRGIVRGADTWVLEQAIPTKSRFGLTVGWTFAVSAGRRLPFAAPSDLTIRPQSPADFGSEAVLGDITTESGEFNKAFLFTCRDRQFASAVMQPTLMTWLLDECPAHGFEISGNVLSCHPPEHELAAEQIPYLLGAVVGFTERVPTFLAEQYPPAAQ
jgi:hypothetical protein